MRTKLWLLFVLTLLSTIKVVAQYTKPIDTLNNDEKCVSILLESKIGVTNSDSLISQLIAKSEYSAQLKTILTNGIIGLPIDNVVIDMEVKEALNQIQRQWQAVEKSRLIAICTKYGIDLSTYEAFIQKWKTDIAFQQSLKPFIEKRLQP